VGDDQATAALDAVLVLPAAKDGAFEVVVVDLRPVARQVVSGEDFLDALPGLGADKRLVASLVLDAFVTDEAFVIGVLEQLVQM
jgi:hypothetical protein